MYTYYLVMNISVVSYGGLPSHPTLVKKESDDEVCGLLNRVSNRIVESSSPKALI